MKYFIFVSKKYFMGLSLSKFKIEKYSIKA